jgi:phthalate 4,5-cis-dihydrodiol dehydrogenase
VPPIGIGLVGLGVAARASAPAFARHPGLRIAAVAEPDAPTRARFAADHGIPGFADLDTLLRQPAVEAVYIATPTPLHAAQTLQALAAGRHVIVEKPMAATLAEAEAMAQGAAAARRVLLVGHSHSFDLPIRRMRALIAAGGLGRLRMVNTWNFTDWVYRPRRPDELDPARGGSVLFRQGAHQVDVIRLLGGGEVTSVQAQVFDCDPERPTIGAHMLMLRFADGAAATAIYNGYGGLPGGALTGGVGEWGFPAPTTSTPRTRLAGDEREAKRARAAALEAGLPPFQPHFGLTIASCERGDIRQSPHGLLVHGPDGQQEIALDGGRTPHDFLAAEFHDAVRGLAPALHDGRWGLANLEICDAALRSARTGAAVSLRHQVALQAGEEG